MGNGVSGDQGNLPSYGKRDVKTAPDRKQHDWSELAKAPNANSLLSAAECCNLFLKIIQGSACILLSPTYKTTLQLQQCVKITY